MFKQADLVKEMDNLRKFACRLTGNPVEADDLLQSTVLRAIEKKHYFEEGTNLFSWTSKIMFNLFVTNYRRKTKFESQYDPEPLIAARSIEADQQTKTELNAVGRAMEELSVEHKEILVLVCVKGMQYQEVADMLAIPVGTVRSRLSRARSQLVTVMDTVKRTPALVHNDNAAYMQAA